VSHIDPPHQVTLSIHSHTCTWKYAPLPASKSLTSAPQCIRSSKSTIYEVPKSHNLMSSWAPWVISNHISVSIQFLDQRSLQDVSSLHVVGMLHSLLTTPSNSMALLYISAQPIHWLINNKSPCHTSKSTCTTSIPWHSSLDANKWHLYKRSCIISLHKTAMLHVSNLMSMTKFPMYSNQVDPSQQSIILI